MMLTAVPGSPDSESRAATNDLLNAFAGWPIASPGGAVSEPSRAAVVGAGTGTVSWLPQAQQPGLGLYL